ncbi:hypothetical protein BH10ACT1_BH10ACT1_32660 [soil metagenome]
MRGDAGRSGHDARAWRSQVTDLAGDRDARADLLDAVAARAAASDRAALEDLIWAVDELHLARPSVRRLVVQDADAEEVEQDVLVAVAETIGSFRGDARFTTWLHTVARNKAIAHLRRRKESVALDDQEVGDAARISSMIATRSALDDAIRSLPELYREAVVLRDIGGCAYDEVAQRLGLNLNTAKARVARGRALAAANLRDLRDPR